MTARLHPAELCAVAQIQELQQKLQQAQSEATQKQASQGELQERAHRAQNALEVRPTGFKARVSSHIVGIARRISAPSI